MPPPVELFEYIKRGGLLEAWNCSFEWWIWNKVCVRLYGWPPLPFWQLRDGPAKARAWALPGKLGKAAEVSGAAVQKDKDGQRLINKFSVPRTPTKNNLEKRIYPHDDWAGFAKFNDYNIDDIRAEAATSAICPDLMPEEQEFELCTRAMNVRGAYVDMITVNAAAGILGQALKRYNTELCTLTCGAVSKASENQKLITWLAMRGVVTNSLDEEHRKRLLNAPSLPADARRAIEIKGIIGSASVKKLYAIQRQAVDGRLHELYIYHGARTGRDTGADVQPTNLPKSGPKLKWCDDINGCGKPYGTHRDTCPHCGAPGWAAEPKSWAHDAVETAISAIRTGSLDHVENIFGDALLTISGCIRGMLVAGDGRDLICSDYSSIEAVVAACLAGEQWRIDAFNRREDIYLVSASRITGRAMDEYAAYFTEHGAKHPDRQKIGKPAELGLGFGGWINAWRQFDDTDTFTDDEVKQNILAWREASPAIVEMWGGQVRGKPWAPERRELYGLEGAAIAAIQYPGQCYAYRGISYGVRDDVLYCHLPSGRNLAYHKPRLGPSDRWAGQLSISFRGWNTNPTMGPIGWIRINTFGGRLFENVVQASARDYFRDGVIRLERAGYPIVLRTYDEVIAEVPEGFGSVEEFENLMCFPRPAWAADWPIFASGGWRGKRYRKD